MTITNTEEARERSPFDIYSGSFFPREHALHCFSCGGAIGTTTCNCTSYNLPRDFLASALEWARLDALAFRAAQTSEIERLRSALVACGRHAGALLADEVSTGLLMHVPEEVRMKLAALPSDDGAREVGVIPPDILPYLQGARQVLERRKQRYPDDWQLGAFGVGYDLLDYLLSCAALATPQRMPSREAVARAIAKAGHIDLSVAIAAYGGIVAACNAWPVEGEEPPRELRIPHARGVLAYADAAILALPTEPMQEMQKGEAEHG